MAAEFVYLRRFRIRAYRSIKTAELKPDANLTALIGPNGSGKSNLLYGILLLRVLGKRSVHDEEDLSASTCQVQADFQIGEYLVYFRGVVQFRTNNQNKDEVISLDQKWNFRNITGENKWIKLKPVRFFSAYPPGGAIYLGNKRTTSFKSHSYIMKFRSSVSRMDLSKISEDGNQRKIVSDCLINIERFTSGIGYYSASQFTNPAMCPTSFEINEDGNLREESVSPQTQFLYDLYDLHAADDPAYLSYLSLVDSNGVGLIDRIEWKLITFSSSSYEVEMGGKVVDKKRERILVVPTIYIGNSQLSFNQLSEGTFRTLAVIFYIVTDKSKLLLIEEPEVCVHHGLLSSIISIIRDFSERKQIIFSTHSDFVIDHLDPENVFVVKKTESDGTTVSAVSKSMSSRQFFALKRYLEMEGNLGEYLKDSGFTL